jgi:hypothetical protein
MRMRNFIMRILERRRRVMQDLEPAGGPQNAGLALSGKSRQSREESYTKGMSHFSELNEGPSACVAYSGKAAIFVRRSLLPTYSDTTSLLLSCLSLIFNLLPCSYTSTDVPFVPSELLRRELNDLSSILQSRITGYIHEGVLWQRVRVQSTERFHSW